jgi:hypothetical protein
MFDSEIVRIVRSSVPRGHSWRQWARCMRLLTLHCGLWVGTLARDTPVDWRSRHTLLPFRRGALLIGPMISVMGTGRIGLLSSAFYAGWLGREVGLIYFRGQPLF